MNQIRETYSKHKFNTHIPNMDEMKAVGEFRLKQILKAKDAAMHDKKAEICKLREEIEVLKSEISTLKILEWKHSLEQINA